MKTKIIMGTGIVSALLVIMIQSQSLEQERSKMRALEESLKEHEELLSEYEKTSLELNMKLTDYESEVSVLESEIEILEGENQKLQEEKSELQSRLDSMIQLEATAYTSECEGCSGITFTGVDVTNTEFHEGKRVVAVDPNVIPLGTELVVHTSEGSFEAIAEDIGEDIQGHRLDILVSNTERAFDFGRQEVTVELQ